jgi:hypothetical protein
MWMASLVIGGTVVLVGSYVAVHLLSALLGAVPFRRIQAPVKQLLSIGTAFVIVTLVGTYVLAGDGELQFRQLASWAAWPSLILLAVQLTRYYLKRPTLQSKD